MRVDSAFGVPVYVLDGDQSELPNEGMYFIVASNGTFIHKDLGYLQATVPVTEISVLNEYKPTPVQCSLPKIPAELSYQIHAFFKTIVEKYCAESVIILYIDRETGQYVFQVPKQAVSHASVRYQIEAMTHDHPNLLKVGTIHSHCDFDAFHSGVDDADEEHWDGVHITYGDNEKSSISITASYVIQGKRMAIEPSDLIEGLEKTGEKNYKLAKFEIAPETMKAWTDQVSHYNPQAAITKFFGRQKPELFQELKERLKSNEVVE